MRNFPVFIAIFIFSPCLYGENLIQFSRDIRPILSDKCFACHGPDEEDRKGHLRLDQPDGEEGAYRTHDGYTAIKPGNLEESLLWELINTDDDEDIMPPVKSKKNLSPSEIKKIGLWISQGAKWEGHWSFNRPEKQNPAPVKNTAWPKNEIDHFILNKLEKEGLQPTKKAPRYKLLRRASYDLTGLPPTPSEIKQFLDDKSPNAWEKAVDKLLQKSAFAERMTLDWLDVARYGDTSVYHADGPRDMWPWRDWVIQSFKKNMPFNTFTIYQLAGDLLPDATYEQKLATGFNRNNGTSDEGGAFDEEYRVEYTIDRSVTTAKTWLGLTMECAVCHDHKYDPISQKEFYQFYAFYNISADKGLQSRRGNEKPTMRIMPEKSRALHDQLEKKATQLKQQLKKRREESKSDFNTWLSKNRKNATDFKDTPLHPDHHFHFDEQKGNVLVNHSATELNAELLNGEIKSEKRLKQNALVFNGKSEFVVKGAANNIDHDTPFSFSFWVKLPKKAHKTSVIAKMDVAARHRGFDVWTENHKIGMHIVHQWPENGLKVLSKKKLKPGKWTHVVINYDGSSKGRGINIYLNSEAIETTILNDNLSKSIKTTQPFKIGKRSISHNYRGSLDELRIYSQILSPDQIKNIYSHESILPLIQLSEGQLQKKEKEILLTSYLELFDQTTKKINQSLVENELAIEELIKKHPTTCMIMQDQKKPRKTYILNRGQYDQPIKDHVIQAGTPSVLPPITTKGRKNRLDLARWLVAKEHPLTARVTVNRYWNLIFGRGLVKTVTDFGAQGEYPTHPKLLDWLAVDFIEHGWDNRHLLKKILMSATYQQDSAATPQLYRHDPENRLLARGPRFRLQGDIIRDSALYISGLLVDHVGGPGVKPYQPKGLWKEVALEDAKLVKVYKRDHGEKLYRKSMYTYWKRSAPPPNMQTFDAPTREKCTISRQRTNTPLQALVLMNDPQFLEASRFLAERILKDGGPTLNEKITSAWNWSVAHPPDQSIINNIKQYYHKMHDMYQQSPKSAKELLSIGEKERDKNLKLAEHAAWTMVASMIFNMDEFITKG